MLSIRPAIDPADRTPPIYIRKRTQGPWDVIIHKIVEDRKQQDLVDTYLAKHPETHLVGDFRGLRKITDRCVCICVYWWEVDRGWFGSRTDPLHL